MDSAKDKLLRVIRSNNPSKQQNRRSGVYILFRSTPSRLRNSFEMDQRIMLTSNDIRQLLSEHDFYVGRTDTDPFVIYEFSKHVNIDPTKQYKRHGNKLRLRSSSEMRLVPQKNEIIIALYVTGGLTHDEAVDFEDVLIISEKTNPRCKNQIRGIDPKKRKRKHIKSEKDTEVYELALHCIAEQLASGRNYVLTNEARELQDIDEYFFDNFNEDIINRNKNNNKSNQKQKAVYDLGQYNKSNLSDASFVEKMLAMDDEFDMNVIANIWKHREITKGRLLQLQKLVLNETIITFNSNV